MLADKYLRDELNKFAKYVIQQSRSNLTKGKKNASKELYNSLGYDITERTNGASLGFNMANYGKFQDRGVSGTEKKYNTPYSYKRGIENRPSPRHFDKWVIRKGLKGVRGRDGKFISRAGLKFAIAASIQKKGIKPSMFFTKPFTAAFKRLPDDLLEAYSIGLEKQIQVNIEK